MPSAVGAPWKCKSWGAPGCSGALDRGRAASACSHALQGLVCTHRCESTPLGLESSTRKTEFLVALFQSMKYFYC